jgi:hypothetical protein
MNGGGRRWVPSPKTETRAAFVFLTPLWLGICATRVGPEPEPQTRTDCRLSYSLFANVTEELTELQVDA